MTTRKVTKRDLQRYLKKWEKGELTKTEIERQLGATTAGVPSARGKWITRQWRSRLGVDTYTSGGVRYSQNLISA